MLKFLGRGSCFNVKEGNNCAYIKENGTLLLIDCGENIFDRILKFDILKEVKNVYVLITHFHSDHVGSLPSFIYYCHYALDIMPKIYFPDKNYLIEYLRRVGVIENENYKILNTTFMGEIPELELDFSCCETTHYSYYESQQYMHKLSFDESKFNNYFRCFSYYLYKNEDTIFYSGDSNNIPDLALSALLNDENVKIYQDTSYKEDQYKAHLSFNKLKELIPKECRNRVYCMHITDSNEFIKEAVEEGFNVVSVSV